MFKKIRRFWLKRVLEKNLLQELRQLKLLEKEQQAKLIVDYEHEFGINFDLVDLETEKKLFDKIYFKDYGNDKMTVIVIMKCAKNYEKIKFSVSKFLTLYPKVYTIKKADLWQIVDVNSGKITLSTCIKENQNGEDLKDMLDSLMKKTSIELFERNILKTTITASDFGEKIYWVTQELYKPMLKPESTVDLKQFCNLENKF